jgi:PAS domain S-box-containing protein
MISQVLVVEDNEALADNIAELFEDLGAEVVVRRRAQEALDHARRQGFDLAIVDIRLPGEHDGLELIPQLRDASPSGETILVTGNATLDSAIGAVRHGAFAYVVKPFDPDELLTLGERALEQVQLRREHQELQSNLSHSEALHRGVIETVEAAIVTLDASGCVLTCNRFALERSGLEAEQLHGKLLSQFAVTDEGRSQLEAMVDQAVRGERSGEREIPMVRQKGKPCVVRWTLTPLQTDRETGARVVAVGLDVTERLELERQKAENEAMAAMGRLTTGVAHEIRNPLNAAKLQLELLIRNARKLGEEAMALRIGERADVVRGELERLSNMLEDFLSLARTRAVESQQFDLAALLGEVRELQGPLAESHGVSLEMELDGEEVPVYGDRERVKQVLINLVGNAMDAVRDHEAPRIRLGTHSDGNGMVEVNVVDNGPGVPEEVQHQLFQPFVTTKAAGTGLGLTVVKRIIELHGGSVTLKSAQPRGTVAQFTLPQGGE